MEILRKISISCCKIDLNPIFEVNKVNFLNGLEGNFYNGNVGASSYIIKKLKSDFLAFKNDLKYQKYINELENAINNSI